MFVRETAGLARRDEPVTVGVPFPRGELKDGRENRWKNLGLHLQEAELATLVTYNAPRPDFKVQLEWEPYSYEGVSWNKLLIESLSHAIE